MTSSPAWKPERGQTTLSHKSKIRAKYTIHRNIEKSERTEGVMVQPTEA